MKLIKLTETYYINPEIIAEIILGTLYGVPYLEIFVLGPERTSTGIRGEEAGAAWTNLMAYIAASRTMADSEVLEQVRDT